MSTLKVVVTGPFSAGKTTFIRSLAGESSVSTEAVSTDSDEREPTTVGLDVARTTVRGRSVKLFGTPGQERFDYMLEILASGTDGMVLLIPGDREEALQRSLTIMGELASDEAPPLVLGVTRTDLGDEGMIERANRTLGARAVGVRCIDARVEKQCRGLLATLVGEM